MALKEVPSSPSFTDISAALDKALADVKARKVTFDKATEAVTTASQDYQSAVDTAVALRNQLNNALNDMLPMHSHVKMSV